MKKSIILLFSLLLTFSYCFATADKSSQITLKESGYPSRSYGPFYFIHHNFLITGVENTMGQFNPEVSFNYLLREQKPWMTVETSELTSLGIKAGSTIQYVDFKTREKKEYIFQDKTHIALIDNEYYKPEDKYQLYNRSFYILLQDSMEGVKHPGEVNSSTDDFTGIAYVGKELTLKKNQTKKLSSSALPLEHEEANKIMQTYIQQLKYIKTPFKLELLRLDQSEEGMLLYQFQGRHKDNNPGVGLVLKTGDNTFLNLTGAWTDTDYSPAMGSFMYMNFVEGHDFVLFLQDSGMHSCFQIRLYKNGVEKIYQLHCDYSGGC